MAIRAHAVFGKLMLSPRVFEVKGDGKISIIWVVTRITWLVRARGRQTFQTLGLSLEITVEIFVRTDQQQQADFRVVFVGEQKQLADT